ncbi:MAG: hypothetical protein L6R28_13225 [Planctomycetes bacterium]|nr:hypothetical protein [Planctomycetota bacterium]
MKRIAHCLAISLSPVLLAGFAFAAGAPISEPWPSPITWKPDPRAVDSGLYIKPRAEAKKATVAFTVTEPSGVARPNWPVRGGLPLFRGELSDPSKIRLLDAAGKELPVQACITAYWPEKTAKFLCIDFLDSFKPGEEKTYTLEYGSEVSNKAPAMKTAEAAGAVTVETGAATFEFKAGAAFLTVKTAKPAATFGPLAGQCLVAKKNDGADPAAHELVIDSIEKTECGAVQTTVHLLGHYGTQKTVRDKLYNNQPSLTKDAWRYPVSMWFRIPAGGTQAYLEFTYGYNADEYSEYVTSYGFSVPTGQAQGVLKFGGDGGASAEAPLGSRLNQWAHDHWTLNGKDGAELKIGKRVAGWAAVEGGGTRVLAAMRECFQNWPVAFRGDEGGALVVEIMGEKPGRALDLVWMETFTTNRDAQKLHDSHNMENGPALSRHYTNSVSWGRAPGLRKIHELLLDFGAPASRNANDTCTAFQKDLLPWPGKQRFKETCALGHIGVWGDERYKDVETYFSVLYDCLPLVHETNGLYGWVDWGDLPLLLPPKDGKFGNGLVGAEGWSNGERALAPYFWHYAAGAGRRFLDNGRAYVHHTIGLDVEHEGGDYLFGNYHRHDQVHWREQNPETSRQSGYRGWHAYHWLTGDPEIKRLALNTGIDADAYQKNMAIRPATRPAKVKMGVQMSSLHYLAYCCWVTSGDDRYARANHAVCKVTLEAARQDKMLYFTPCDVGDDGEPINYDLSGCKPGGAQVGYFYTYGGDDLLLEWASLTGDPAAVDAILALGKYHEDPKIRVSCSRVCSPEALYVGLALLDPKNPQLVEMVKARDPATPHITRGKFTTDGTYKSAEDWHKYGVWLYGKNAMSIVGANGLEFLHSILCYELMEAAGGKVSLPKE